MDSPDFGLHQIIMNLKPPVFSERQLTILDKGLVADNFEEGIGKHSIDTRNKSGYREALSELEKSLSNTDKFYYLSRGKRNFYEVRYDPIKNVPVVGLQYEYGDDGNPQLILGIYPRSGKPALIISYIGNNWNDPADIAGISIDSSGRFESELKRIFDEYQSNIKRKRQEGIKSGIS